MKTYRIASIPGDGIGKEVVPAGEKLLEALAAHSGGTATAGVGPRMKGLLAGRPQITVLEAVPAGTAEQGVL